MALKPEAAAAARKIKLLVMDCDGVLTDGRLYFGTTGEELKVFHVRDGQGLVYWHREGMRSAVLSGRESSIVELRARQLGVEFVIQGRDDKRVALRDLMAEAGVVASQVAYIGDDVPDAECAEIVGLFAAPADAHPSALAAADVVTAAAGGRGSVRELIDLLIEAKKAA